MAPFPLERASGNSSKMPGLIPKYFHEMGMSRFPPEIVLPASIPFSYLKADEVVHYWTPLNQPLIQDYEWLGNTVHVWAAYRESKIIYRVEPFLSECLSRSAWPCHVPTEALRLSGRCVIIELPADPKPTYVAAVFDLATGAQTSEILELRLSNYCLPLSGDRPNSPLFSISGSPYLFCAWMVRISPRVLRALSERPNRMVPAARTQRRGATTPLPRR
jgi:hypothetical protein